MVINYIAEAVAQGRDALEEAASALFEPVIRLGVTGLSGAGKTVFITSLVANLIARQRMPHLVAEAEGRIEAVYLQPQPDDTVPRFDYESNLAALVAPEPAWPQGTRAVSQLRISLRVRPVGLLSGLRGVQRIHIDIVDYPGEWLLDLALLNQSYDAWSEETLDWLAGTPDGAAYLSAAAEAAAAPTWEEPELRRLAEAFGKRLHAARERSGIIFRTPGRFLLPGELADSPALTFAPLPATESAPRRGLRDEMARRFEAYKRQVVGPFFRDHFARIDRQIVLVDVLDALARGPAAVTELRAAMTGILRAFRHGGNDLFSRLLRGRQVDRLLFAATKADHLHHVQHDRLSAIAEALVEDARERARFRGAKTGALALASLRSTTEEILRRDGEELPSVRGRLLKGGEAILYAGDLPEDPRQLLSAGDHAAGGWLDRDYGLMAFAPPRLGTRAGLPHIRLDRATEFLIGDLL